MRSNKSTEFSNIDCDVLHCSNFYVDGSSEFEGTLTAKRGIVLYGSSLSFSGGGE
ncbi:MAG: hypothetical protein NC218_02560 [Acetobacter sp.]|nr:hypothetical protein [Acetobacter sp.]